MGVRHPQTAGGFAHAGVNAGDARIGVADNGEQSVGGERSDGQAVGAFAKPGNGHQKPEQRQARDRLDDIRAAQNRSVQARPTRQQNAQRETDGGGQQRGGGYQPQMLQGQAGNFGTVFVEKPYQIEKEI